MNSEPKEAIAGAVAITIAARYPAASSSAPRLLQPSRAGRRSGRLARGSPSTSVLPARPAAVSFRDSSTAWMMPGSLGSSDVPAGFRERFSSADPMERGGSRPR